MRITILNNIEGFQNVYLEVQEWICTANKLTRKTAEVIHSTDLAVLLRIQDKNVWLPKSTFTVHSIPKGLDEWQ